jgi:hypothetical protein
MQVPSRPGWCDVAPLPQAVARFDAELHQPQQPRQLRHITRQLLLHHAPAQPYTAQPVAYLRYRFLKYETHECQELCPDLNWVGLINTVKVDTSVLCVRGGPKLAGGLVQPRNYRTTRLAKDHHTQSSDCLEQVTQAVG